MEIVIGYLIVFVIQFVLCYGILFAHLQRNWPTLAVKYKSTDKRVALTCGFTLALIPLAGIFAALCATSCGKHGFLYK